MSKRHASKYKIDRRLGENIWGRPKSSVNRRAYGPGQHGQRRKSKVSDFGIQLRAKQKLRGYYGDVTEKQFKDIIASAAAARQQQMKAQMAGQIADAAQSGANAQRLNASAGAIRNGQTQAAGLPST